MDCEFNPSVPDTVADPQRCVNELSPTPISVDVSTDALGVETLESQENSKFCGSSVSSRIRVLNPNRSLPFSSIAGGSVKTLDESASSHDFVVPQSFNKVGVSSFLNRDLPSIASKRIVDDENLVTSRVETLDSSVGGISVSSSEDDSSNDSSDCLHVAPLQTRPPVEPWVTRSYGSNEYMPGWSNYSSSCNAFASSPSLKNCDEEDLSDHTEGYEDLVNKYEEGKLSGNENRRSPPRYGFQNPSENCSASCSRRETQVTGFRSLAAWRENHVDWENLRPDSLQYAEGSGLSGVGAGLSNLGNTCFMNAILQCLTHTVPLVEALRSCKPKCSCSCESFCMHCALLYHIEHSLAFSGKTIAPVYLFHNLRKISNDFQQGQQEDAHEFLLCLLHRLEGCFERSLSSDDNVVERVFGGRLLSRLRCSPCGHSSHMYEPLEHLCLEIEGAETLENALESFTKVEKMEDPDVKYICEKCMKEVTKEKQYTIDKAPMVLIFQLKRFKNNGYSFGKIGEHVKFPLELDLSPYTNCSQENEDLKYQLYAIVVHDGYSQYSGHYYCYIRSSPNTWHELNDSSVFTCTEETALSQSAYMLFYARENTPWPSILFEFNKHSSDPCVSNYSPKSVLEGADIESTFCPNMLNLDSSRNMIGDAAEETSTEILQSAVVNEVRDVTLKDEITYEERQNEHDLSMVESEDNTAVVEASVPPPSSACSDKAICDDKPSLEQNVCSREAVSTTTSELHKQTANKSSSPEARRHKPHDHLKVQNRVNIKRASKSPKELERREAARYISKNVSSSRGMRLLAALNPSKVNKRHGSSPYKKQRRLFSYS